MTKKSVPELRFKGFFDDWEQRKLGEIVSFYTGLTYSPNDIVEVPGTLVLRSSNIKNGQIVFTDAVYVKSNAANSDQVKINDIIVVVRNGSRSLIGKHSKIKEEMQNTVIGAFMTGIRSTESSFINALLDTFVNRVLERSTGTSYPAIKSSTLANLSVKIPNDNNEQQQIGTFFKQLDDTFTLYQRKLECLNTLKKAYLQQLFPRNGESTPKIRFANFEGNWEQRKLGDIAQITMGQSPKSENYTDNPKDYILVQGNADIKNGLVHPRVWTKQITKCADKGDLVLCVRAPVGDVGKTNYNIVIGRGVASIKGNDFVFYQLKKMKENNFWARIITGSTFESINSSNIKNALIFSPNNDEQIKIGILLNNFDKNIISLQNNLDNFKSLKKYFLQKLFI